MAVVLTGRPVRPVHFAGTLLMLAALAACGGSSSETPPPLPPLPQNVHYNRSATTLPEEPVTSAPDASAKPAPQTKP
jgi:hypothetical protein